MMTILQAAYNFISNLSITGKLNNISYIIDRAADQSLEDIHRELNRIYAIGKDKSLSIEDYLGQTEGYVYDQLNLQVRRLSIVRKYNEVYPKNKFLFYEKVKEICSESEFICIPITKYTRSLPLRAMADLMNFHPADEDIWVSNYSENIIEFNELPSAIRIRFSDIKGVVKQPGNSPGDEQVFTQDQLCPLPFYVCIRRNYESYFRENKIPNAIVLHPVLHGFLIVTRW